MSAKLGLSPVALGLATVVLAAWLVWLWWLAYFHTGDDVVTWSRLVLLLHSVEAVAFAAAGAVFGTQVHKQRADEANQRAAKAEDAADKGKMLAAAVRAEARAEQGSVEEKSFARTAGSESLRLANPIMGESQ